MPIVSMVPVQNGAFIPTSPAVVSGGVGQDIDLAPLVLDETVALADEDNTRVNFGAANHPANWTFLMTSAASLGIVPGAVVNSVTVKARTKRAAPGGGATMALIFLKNGSVSRVSNAISQSTNYANIISVLPTNPFTSLPWTATDFDGLEVGAQNAGVSAGIMTAIELLVDFIPAVWYTTGEGEDVFSSTQKTTAGSWTTMLPVPNIWSPS